MKPRGMQDVPTAQTLINRSVPASRVQIVAQLARMEHEKVRLERELSVWVGKQKETEGRLQQARQHIELLQGALDKSSADHPSPMADDVQEAETWREIPLEY